MSMLIESQFAKDVKKAQRLLNKAIGIVDGMSQKINNNISEGIVDDAIEYENISEQIINSARLLPIHTGNPNAKGENIDRIIENTKVVLEKSDDYFYIKIPSLLPKKEKGNPEYIRTTLDAAFKKYKSQNDINRYTEKVVLIFKHCYSKERSYREYRDHDNIELNAVVDVIALYLLEDDSATKCNHYYCSAEKESDYTEIYIVPLNNFCKWLEDN